MIPMECSQVKAILFEYADYEIPVEFRREVEEHLAACRSCSSQLEALKEQSDAFRALPRATAPMEFMEQVRSRLEEPSVFLRLKDRLAAFFAGRHFLQLAGTAAAGVLIVAAAQVVLQESGHKALPPTAPPPVKSSPAPGVLPLAQEPAAPPAKPQSPPEIRSEKAKALKKAATAANSAALRPSPGVEAQLVSITLKLPGASAKLELRDGGANNYSESGPPAGMGGPAPRRAEQQVSRGGGEPAEVPGGRRPSDAQRISSDVVRLIKGANGKILSTKPALYKNQPETLMAEMPAANYPSFVEQLRLIGEIEFNGNKEFSPAPDSRVRVTVGFAAGD